MGLCERKRWPASPDPGPLVLYGLFRTNYRSLSKERNWSLLLKGFKGSSCGQRNSLLFQVDHKIMCYKRIGYNINIMRQSACLVFNPVSVNNFTSLFNCTPVGRASDSMIAPT